MELTNQQIYNAVMALQQLGAERLPVMFSFHLAKLGKTLRSHFEAIDETRVSLIKKHRGEEKELTANSEHWEEFQEEYKLLMAEKVTINFDIVQIPENLNKPCDKCGRSLEIPFSILMNLEPFIEVKC